MESKNAYFSSCNGWDVAFLKDISLKIGSGSTPRGGESAYIYERTNFAFIRSQNVYDFTFDVTGLRFISDEDANKLKGVHLQKDDVLLNITGDGVTFSRCCLVPEEILPAAVNQHVAIIRLDKTKCLPGYLMAYLCLPETKAYIESFNAGGSRRAITKGNIESFEIPLPPMIIQEHISRVTSGFLVKRHINIQLNQTLEQMAQALFKSWFVDFDPVVDNALDAGFFEQDLAFPDELLRRAEARRAVREHGDFKPLPDATRQLFPAAFEECDDGSFGLGGWVPKGWNPSNIGAEFDVTMGQSPPSSTYNEIGEGMPFFQGKTDFGFRFPSNRIYCTEPKRMARKNDTLVSVRAPVGDINLAAEDCAIGRGIAAARHKSGSISFSYYAMNNLSTHFKVFESEGTVFGSINQKDFKDLPLIKFPAQVVSKFDEICGCWDKRIENIAIEVAALTKLRDTLLPKLISGELRLDQIEADLAKEGMA